ncbi:DUF1376 domain-containing protein [Azospirillum sp. YIM B02556]|uniref:DUF1376 domain-containing protein n=1 Tax=Azospirillum endophyticum TaxID=2800326 RepID=A0ABS1F3J2_9PROT|nr:DUF1376 domain-containing protein [Azospirillum endophyticum]MBK1837996.1 DUF1376 domain-containing protein [Azospirillum endophyticum]
MDTTTPVDQLPDPLVPAEVDLRGYGWMPLYGDRLKNSETWILASAEGKVAALHLWWQAFAHEVPAGSLPSDDRLLARAADYGTAITAWRAIKEEALRGWVLCSDGRYYHPFLCELALQAWETRRADVAKKEAERARKKAQRDAEKDRTSAGRTTNVRRTDDECPADNPPASAGFPPENALKGEERKGSKNPPPLTPPPASRRTSSGAVAVVNAFVAAKDARWPEYAEQIAPRMTMLALAEQHLEAGGTVELLTEVIQRGVRDWKNPTPPTSLAALKNSLADRIAQHRRALEGNGTRKASGPSGEQHEVDPHDQSRQRLRHWCRTGRWEPRWGEMPGHRSCLIPERVILEVIPDFAPDWCPPAAESERTGEGAR